MGDMADYDIEQGEALWFDHLAGHTQFPSDMCPYCEAEYISMKNKSNGEE